MTRHAQTSPPAEPEDPPLAATPVQHAHPVLHLLDPKPDDAAPWSARHLPGPRASAGLRLAVVAVTAGLIVVVLASQIRQPIDTAGSRAEPRRFQTSAEQGQVTLRRSAASTMQMASTVPAHR